MNQININVNKKKPDDAFMAGILVFGLHLVSGSLFYYLQLTQPANPWW